MDDPQEPGSVVSKAHRVEVRHGELRVSALPPKASGSITATGSISAVGKAPRVVTEVRHTVITEYRASDGLRWATTEEHLNGHLDDFDLHHLT